jgi:predicted GNAT family acetyltransferase
MTELVQHTNIAQTITTDRDRPSAEALLSEHCTPQEIAALSNRQLRIMVNHAYKLMDTDFPSFIVINCYEMIVDEFEHRARRVAAHGASHRARETFRDNPLYRRFELFHNGDLAAYVKYTLAGGDIVLIDGAEQPGHHDPGIGATLVRHILLNSHRRRLRVVPRCSMVYAFLADHPQYRALIAR